MMEFTAINANVVPGPANVNFQDISPAWWGPQYKISWYHGVSIGKDFPEGMILLNSFGGVLSLRFIGKQKDCDGRK